MRKELFGVFGDRDTFESFRTVDEFDHVVSGNRLTVGIRDVALGFPGRSQVAERGEDVAAVWGEAYLEESTADDAGAHLLEAEAGPEAVFSTLNGSYLAVLDDADGARIATDPLRSWECFYTDDPGVRVFGTDPAAVTATMSDTTTAAEPVAEFMHLGVVLADRTVVDGLRRIPFDSYLTETSTHELDRFVYDPQSFDYAGDLADRLERALERRSTLPGRKGLLLSGGYDSRVIAAGVDDLSVCYTIGADGSDEMRVAERIADQYDAAHARLEPDERYLNTAPDTVRYGQGIRESIHIHHAGYGGEMDVQTMFHGAFGDTLMRGHFLPVDSTEVFDLKCPPYAIDDEPDVAEHFAEKFGYYPVWHHNEDRAADRSESDAFIQRRFSELIDRWDHRYDRIANGMALLGIQNQPTLPFRYHLADNYVESFPFVDAEIVEWHLQTPLEHRNTETFLAALRQVDDSILRHRPPDRPYDSFTLNQIDGFLRRKLPLLSGYDGPWPDREILYDRVDLDRKILPGYPELHDLPWRVKLRVNDLTTWLELAADAKPLRPDRLFAPDDEPPIEASH